jgi:hypothetical protein
VTAGEVQRSFELSHGDSKAANLFMHGRKPALAIRKRRFMKVRLQ